MSATANPLASLSDEDLQIYEDLLKAKQQPTPAGPQVDTRPWSDKLGLKNPVARFATDAAEGAASGAASTVFHGGDLIRRGLGMERVIDRPEVQQGMKRPETLGGKVGNWTEQAAEYAIPGSAAEGLASKLPQATSTARVLGKAIINALSAGGVATAQTGSPESGAEAAAIGGALGGGAEALSSTPTGIGIKAGVKKAKDLLLHKIPYVGPAIEGSVQAGKEAAAKARTAETAAAHRIANPPRAVEPIAPIPPPDATPIPPPARGTNMSDPRIPIWQRRQTSMPPPGSPPPGPPGQGGNVVAPEAMAPADVAIPNPPRVKHAMMPGEGYEGDIPLKEGQIPTRQDYRNSANKRWGVQLGTYLRSLGKSAEDIKQMTENEVNAHAKDLGLKPWSTNPESRLAQMQGVMDILGSKPMNKVTVMPPPGGQQ